MDSGLAYRCRVPNRVVLPFHRHCDRKRAKKLYKAPPNKPSKRKRKRVPLFELPLELLDSILLKLDLPSMGMLRRVNKTGRLIVESLPEYSLLKKHASDTLRLMHSADCSRYFPISQLFAEFCQPWCRTCGGFGPFLYFPTATRSCFKCNYIRPEYHLARVSAIRFNFVLSKKQIEDLPIITARTTRRTRLADITQAEALAMKVHGSREAMRNAYYNKIQEHKYRYEIRLENWKQNGMMGRRPRAPSRPRLRKYPRGERYDKTAVRMWATALFPYWDWQTRTLEPGVYCRACTYRAEEDTPLYMCHMGTIWDRYPARGEEYHRAFLEAEMPEHFLNCSAVQKNYNFEDIQKARHKHLKRKGKNFIVTPRKTEI